MSWSLKLGKVAGIPVLVHWTFFILLAFFGYTSWEESHDLKLAAEGTLFVVALFACVVLHELGHALAALRFGVKTVDITLLPFGGVARLKRMPERPLQELVVALAGPAVNLIIAGTIWALGEGPVSPPAGESLTLTGSIVRLGFWPTLLVVNLWLFLFNLVPAFPMDGGRVLRALLAMHMDYARATRAAASVGQLLAIGLGLLGLTSGNPMLVLICLFVWIGAEAEARQAEMGLALRDVKVGDVMITEFHTLAPDDTLGTAVEYLLTSTQHDFPVQDEGGPTGLLTREDLLRGLSERGRDAPIREYAQPGLGTVEADAPIVPAWTRLREGTKGCLQVVSRGRPVGLLLADHIGEYLRVRAALHGADPHGRERPR
jgi:stage IV sporulation protein FB